MAFIMNRVKLLNSTFRFPIRRNQSNKSILAFDKHQLFHDNNDLDTLEQNILLRNHENNIPKIRSLISDLKMEQNLTKQKELHDQLDIELNKLPNRTHPRVKGYEHPKELLVHKKEKQHSSKSRIMEFSEFCKCHNLFRMDHLGNFSGHKSYYLTGFLAEMEQSLVQYALQNLKQNGFRMISVPDILPGEVIEGCGMHTDGERTQVYKLDSGKFLSGTSEMALAGYFAGKQFQENELPIRVAAVSRCYRAETSGLQEEKGIYRVHQFTKVEMFSICSENQSEHVLETFKNIEVELFMNLGLDFRLIEMPPNELGTPAYQKYDIEAWMPGRNMWGEISSCSNCTDYQARRLNIKYVGNDGQQKYVHTVNGTASAIPRLLIAIIESYQTDPDSISLPSALEKYMKNKSIQNNIPELKLVKSIKSPN